MQILIEEDDPALGSFLKRCLELEGHGAALTVTGDDALAYARRSPTDLAILNAGATVRDGSTLVPEMRRVQPEAALLALLDFDSVGRRVRCLDQGADDCMTKPFSIEELMARCRALLRRKQRTSEILLQHGDLLLNRVSRRVSFAGREIRLTSKEFTLLQKLAERRGACCSRSELQTEVFEIAAETATNVVDVYIHYLRKKLGSEVGRRVIVTVRNAGYRMDEVYDTPGVQGEGEREVRPAGV
jgi:DNA-binding response OmpR family regulator